MASHILPKRVYYTIFAILLFCTYLTVQIAFFDLGPLNTVAALAIACFKATLVILFFMHLKYDRLFHSVVFVSALLAATLFVGFTLMDTGQYQHTNIWQPEAPPLAPYGPRPTTG